MDWVNSFGLGSKVGSKTNSHAPAAALLEGERGTAQGGLERFSLHGVAHPSKARLSHHEATKGMGGAEQFSESQHHEHK